MMRRTAIAILLTVMMGSMETITLATEDDQAVVYSVSNALNMGNPGESQVRDFYVNRGQADGVTKGQKLKVYRKVASYNLMTQKLYRDLFIPVGVLKVIHTENEASIARLEKLYSDSESPTLSPKAVMVGDYVQVTP